MKFNLGFLLRVDETDKLSQPISLTSNWQKCWWGPKAKSDLDDKEKTQAKENLYFLFDLSNIIKIMKVLDSNPKLLLVSNKTTTYILNKPNLTIFGQCEIPFKLGSLQYYTGIAAFGKGSLIHIYGNSTLI